MKPEAPKHSSVATQTDSDVLVSDGQTARFRAVPAILQALKVAHKANERLNGRVEQLEQKLHDAEEQVEMNSSMTEGRRDFRKEAALRRQLFDAIGKSEILEGNLQYLQARIVSLEGVIRLLQQENAVHRQRYPANPPDSLFYYKSAGKAFSVAVHPSGSNNGVLSAGADPSFSAFRPVR